MQVLSSSPPPLLIFTAETAPIQLLSHIASNGLQAVKWHQGAHSSTKTLEPASAVEQWGAYIGQIIMRVMQVVANLIGSSYNPLQKQQQMTNEKLQYLRQYVQAINRSPNLGDQKNSLAFLWNNRMQQDQLMPRFLGSEWLGFRINLANTDDLLLQGGNDLFYNVIRQAKDKEESFTSALQKLNEENVSMIHITAWAEVLRDRFYRAEPSKQLDDSLAPIIKFFLSPATTPAQLEAILQLLFDIPSEDKKIDFRNFLWTNLFLPCVGRNVANRESYPPLLKHFWGYVNGPVITAAFPGATRPS